MFGDTGIPPISSFLSQTCPAVFLVWSVSQSHCFQGYARMTSAVRDEETKWAGERGTVIFTSAFNVQWINTFDQPGYYAHINLAQHGHQL